MVIDANSLLALDIETTGLDPGTAILRAAAIANSDGTRVLIGDEEVDLLRDLEGFVAGLPLDVSIVTWNGEEFDMPFLAWRFKERGVESTLRVTRLPQRGKYGGHLYHADWGGRRHVDIAPYLKDQAASLGIPWSLKPVVRAVLGVEPVEVDRSGDAISRLDPGLLARYVASDAEITLALARRLALTLEPA
jgi:DNA polymerase elongation subunit (family B)